MKWSLYLQQTNTKKPLLKLYINIKNQHRIFNKKCFLCE